MKTRAVITHESQQENDGAAPAPNGTKQNIKYSRNVRVSINNHKVSSHSIDRAVVIGAPDSPDSRADRTYFRITLSKPPNEIVISSHTFQRQACKTTQWIEDFTTARIPWGQWLMNSISKQTCGISQYFSPPASTPLLCNSILGLHCTL